MRLAFPWVSSWVIRRRRLCRHRKPHHNRGWLLVKGQGEDLVVEQAGLRTRTLFRLVLTTCEGIDTLHLILDLAFLAYFRNGVTRYLLSAV